MDVFGASLVVDTLVLGPPIVGQVAVSPWEMCPLAVDSFKVVPMMLNLIMDPSKMSIVALDLVLDLMVDARVIGSASCYAPSSASFRSSLLFFVAFAIAVFRSARLH